MKTIYLVRHARSVARGSEIPDLERPLTKQGKKETRSISKILVKEGFIPDLIFSSPAIRAIETASISAKHFGYAAHDVIEEKYIYKSNVESLLTLLKSLDDKYSSVMLFGHDPLISELAGNLTKDFHGRILQSGVACIECKRNYWKNIVRRIGNLRFTLYPEDIPRQKAYYEECEKKFELQIQERFEEILRKKEIYIGRKTKNNLKKPVGIAVKTFMKLLKESEKNKKFNIKSDTEKTGTRKIPPHTFQFASEKILPQKS